MKKRMTEQQEFEIMKLVLDKFLWLGFGIMAFGLYKMFYERILNGVIWMFTGAVVLVIFLVIIVREYEIVK